MKRITVLALALLVLCAGTGCELLKERVKSVVKVTAYDQTGSTYGYLTVMLIDANGRVIASDQVNERGVVIFEGVAAGTYTIGARNVAQVDLVVVEPASVTVTLGKTVDVRLVVQRPEVSGKTPESPW